MRSSLSIFLLMTLVPAPALAQEELSPPISGPLALFFMSALALAILAFLRRRLRGAELRMASAEQRAAALEAAFDAANPMLAGWPEEKIHGPVLISPALMERLGIEALSGPDDLLDGVAAEDRETIRNGFAALRTEETPFDAEIRMSDGTPFRVEGRLGEALVREARYAVLTFKDISEVQTLRDEAATLRNETAAQMIPRAALLEAMPMLAWIRGADGRLVAANEEYAKAVEMSIAQTVAESIELDGKPSPDRRPEGLSIREAPVVTAGDRRHMRLIEMPVAGTEISLGLAEDIEDMVATRRDRDRHLASQQEILGVMKTAIAVFGPDKRITFHNAAYELLWRLEASWLETGPTLFEIQDELRRRRRLPEVADRNQERDRLSNLFTDVLQPVESITYRPDGHAVRVVVAPHPMGGLIELSDDVTGTLEIERAYNTLMAVQNASLDNLAEALFVVGEDGLLHYANAAFRNLWDIPAAELDDKPHVNRLTGRLADQVTDGSRPLLAERMRAATYAREPVQTRLDLLGGQVVDYSTVPLPDGSVMHRFLDMTDSAQVERALRASNRALEETDRLKTDFVANVSYQLRTPLNAIQGFAEILTQGLFGDLSEKQNEYAEGITASANELRELIDAILDLASIDAGLLTLDRRETDVEAMLTAVAQLTGDWARRAGIDVTLSLEGSMGTALLDETRVRQVIYNLISNAIRFSGRGTTITIAAMRVEDGLSISVIDEGSGLDPADWKRALGRFESHGRNSGAGLGLSLAENLVSLQSGTIWVEPNDPAGTNVTFRLPVWAD